MSWVKVDDKLHSHPKAIEAGLEAMGLWVLALSYCGDYLTDGWIPRGILLRIGGPDAEGLARKLVDAGLWSFKNDAWLFNDYTDYNPTAAEEKAKRSKDLARKKQKKSAADSARIPRGNQTERSRKKNGFVSDSNGPDPDPDPIEDRTKVRSSDARPASEPEGSKPQATEPKPTATHLPPLEQASSERTPVAAPTGLPLAPIVDSGAVQGPANQNASELTSIVSALESIEGLRHLASVRTANRLQGLYSPGSGRTLADLLAAIRLVGKDADCEARDSNPWSLEHLQSRCGRVINWALSKEKREEAAQKQINNRNQFPQNKGPAQKSSGIDWTTRAGNFQKKASGDS